MSATPANADRVIDRVWEFCIPRGIAFKFLADRLTLLLRNAKYADRTASGKFVTLYPRSLEQFEAVLTGLGEQLAGEPGPYVLSDLRWSKGPLFVRYGGFAERWIGLDDGRTVPAIEDPDGQLVPDERKPVFEMPSWVKVPAILVPSIAARAASERPEDFPYRIEEPLHFSNGGGVYRAVDTRTCETVVLREARPHAGLDPSGADAVTRLHHERDIFTALAGLHDERTRVSNELPLA